MDDIAAPRPLLELAVGTLVLVVIIFMHGAGIRTINRGFSQAWVRVNTATPYWWINSLLAMAIGGLAVLHLAETLVWALPIYYAGMISTLRDSYYFVLESYTTLGSGNVNLPERWRLIGPVIAMSGLFTFGWTASVLVNIMSEFGKFDRDRAKESQE